MHANGVRHIPQRRFSASVSRHLVQFRNGIIPVVFLLPSCGQDARCNLTTIIVIYGMQSIAANQFTA
jgi:hypothetical protein